MLERVYARWMVVVVVRLLGVSSASASPSAVRSCFVAQIGPFGKSWPVVEASHLPTSEYRSIHDYRLEGYEPGGIVMIMTAVDSAAALGSVIFRLFFLC
jgi:hypothetical protein